MFKVFLLATIVLSVYAKEGRHNRLEIQQNSKIFKQLSRTWSTNKITPTSIESSEKVCPNLAIVKQTFDVNERSISPWRYSINEDHQRIPEKIAFAQCLCSGCIDIRTGHETNALNSVEINQSMVVMRMKENSSDQKESKKIWTVERISVPVACICVRPKINP
ncbi:interleukin-17C [Polypterus senegalus]|uniref:interleukin-17C n=1 Tax=Polypterus senegalus TaxID=55291 RepID=UPI001966CC14|nr:interleukin-17C [Polypterus senegalus]